MTVCVEAQTRVLGPTHPHTLNSVRWLENIETSVGLIVMQDAQKQRREVKLEADSPPSRAGTLKKLKIPKQKRNVQRKATKT